MIAAEQQDFEAARESYLISLAIKEKHGSPHDAATTYGQLGILAGRQRRFEESGRWLIRCLSNFLSARDQHNVKRAVRNFLDAYREASAADKQKLELIWQEANLGPFPTPPTQP